MLKIQIKIQKYILLLCEKIQKNTITESILIQTPYVTLDSIKKTISSKIPGAYLRFGDGDILLMEYKNELLQKRNEQLAIEMKEAFSLAGTGIFKCLPLHSKRYGMMEHMCPGVHEGSDKWARDMLSRTYKYFIGNLIYSHVALSYVTAYDSEYAISFYRFLKSQNIVFVGNETVDKNIINKLFGQAIHIKTPCKGSFSEINRIEDELIAYLEKNKNLFLVVVVAMGCSGRVLEKRILKAKLNCFLFDFGSTMDIFCKKKTRAWMEIDNTIDNNHYQKILEII